MDKTYIYIDDSGDPGFSESSSSNFIIASVIVIGEEKSSILNDALNLYRRNLGWDENQEFKFSKNQKTIIKETIHFLNTFDYSAYAIVLDKNKIDKNILPSSKRESVYMFVIKELLKKLSISNATIIIDGSYGSKYIKDAKVYLRQQLKKSGIENYSIKFSDSRKNVLIQLADLVAGSVSRSLSDKKDAKDYIDAFGSKIKKIFWI